jgi:hypothetical protein
MPSRPAPLLRVSEGFAPLVVPFELALLDTMTESICGTWADRRIAYVNPTWLAFAASNSAPELADHEWLGADPLLVVPNVLRRFYVDMFRCALETGETAEHDYECSSPTRGASSTCASTRVRRACS